jgi:23S rRNA (adenine2503-C2)-methyltransferase
MGMGEPLLNYEASLGAIRRMVDPHTLNIGQRHITLSTVGFVPGIDRLAREPGLETASSLQITLAVSLHAATDELRDRLVPINRRYNLEALFDACYRYTACTGRRISFEWTLIEGVNDTGDQADALVHRLSGMKAHVNLIPINPTRQYYGQPPAPDRGAAFTEILDRHQISYTIRLRRGTDIEAGCGQLKQRHEESDR